MLQRIFYLNYTLKVLFQEFGSTKYDTMTVYFYEQISNKNRKSTKETDLMIFNLYVEEYACMIFRLLPMYFILSIKPYVLHTTL